MNIRSLRMNHIQIQIIKRVSSRIIIYVRFIIGARDVLQPCQRDANTLIGKGGKCVYSLSISRTVSRKMIGYHPTGISGLKYGPCIYNTSAVLIVLNGIALTGIVCMFAM